MLRRTPIFKAKFISPAKKLVRADLYHNVSAAFRKGNPTPKFGPKAPELTLCLPGEGAEDVRVQRAFWPGAEIVAADWSNTAIRAAVDAGATHVIAGDLREINTKSEFRRHYFDLVNLDLCATINHETEDLCRRVGKRSGRFFAVFFSYGHDKLSRFSSHADWAAEQSSRRDDGIVGKTVERVRDALGDAVAVRVGHFLGTVCGSQSFVSGYHSTPVNLGRLVRVYRYRGNRVPMLGLVFDALGWDSGEWSPFCLDETGRNFRERILESKMDPAQFGLLKSQVAAWKAVRTRKLKSKAVRPPEPGHSRSDTA